MPLSSIAKQGNGVYPEPGPVPHRSWTRTIPDAEGQYIADELHSFSCPCRRCKAEKDRIDRLIEWNRPKAPMETEE